MKFTWRQSLRLLIRFYFASDIIETMCCLYEEVAKQNELKNFPPYHRVSVRVLDIVVVNSPFLKILIWPTDSV